MPTLPIDDNRSVIDRWRDSGVLRAKIDSLNPAQLEAFPYLWDVWARVNQQIPPGMGTDFRLWFFRAGRGAGKTLAGAQTIRRLVDSGQAKRIALVGPTAADVRDVMIEGESGLLSVFPDAERPQWQPSIRRVTFANGAIATSYSADEPERLRGPQHDFCFIAGTLVETARGPVPVEQIVEGDLIHTRNGMRPCLATASRTERVVTITHERGTLTGTLDHPVFVDGDWKPLGLIKPCDTLTVWNGRLTQPDARTDTCTGARFIATAGYGSSTTDRYPRATTSTTSTTTEPMTASRICSACRRRSIDIITTMKRTQQPAFGATVSSHSEPISHGNIATIASESECESCSDKPTADVEANAPVFSAEQSSYLDLDNSAVLHVSTDSELRTVYNLMVLGTHEYFANGVLVHNCWIDEPASMPRGEEAMSNLLLGLRLGDAPWAMLTGTPKPVAWLRALADRPDTITTTGSTFDNERFLASTFIEDITARYGDTRVGRQELLAEWLEDVEGALFTEAMIDGARIADWQQSDPWASLGRYLGRDIKDRRAWRVIVAVDPPGETAECGIVVATAPTQGQAGRDHAVILEDASTTGRPEEWGAAVVAAARRWDAERVVVESNQGGDMVRATIAAVDSGLRIEKIHAKVSKAARAEPVSVQYERGHIHHAGFHPLLESQMVSWVPSESKSPDRMDAMVHAVATLLTSTPITRATVTSAAMRRL